MYTIWSLYLYNYVWENWQWQRQWTTHDCIGSFFKEPCKILPKIILWQCSFGLFTQMAVWCWRMLCRLLTITLRKWERCDNFVVLYCLLEYFLLEHVYNSPNIIFTQFLRQHFDHGAARKITNNELMDQHGLSSKERWMGKIDNNSAQLWDDTLDKQTHLYLFNRAGYAYSLLSVSWIKYLPL